MDKILSQLVEISNAFDTDKIKLIIIGGVATYFRALQSKQPARTTHDIDLCLPESEISIADRRLIVSSVLIDTLLYKNPEGKGDFRLTRADGSNLDVLCPSVEGVEEIGGQLVLIADKLHGFQADGLAFIEEGLVAVKHVNIQFYIPSVINHLILKLNAFYSNNTARAIAENESALHKYNRAIVHALDICTIVKGASTDDFVEANRLVKKYNMHKVIREAITIIKVSFLEPEDAGWHLLLDSGDFLPEIAAKKKLVEVELLTDRLKQLFLIV